MPDEDPFDIRWRPIPGETFLEVDRERRTLWLNKRYRLLLTGDDYGSLNDAPLLKGLLYLLTQEVFKGSYLGPRDKDSIDLWQQVLTAAARAESPMTTGFALPDGRRARRVHGVWAEGRVPDPWRPRSAAWCSFLELEAESRCGSPGMVPPCRIFRNMSTYPRLSCGLGSRRGLSC